MQIKYESWMLLSEATIGYYNRLLHIMEPIGSELPRLWTLLNDAKSAPLTNNSSDEPRAYRDRVQRVAELLNRRHYRVGLLGRSGVGKSSLFNSIIRTERINREGRSSATTRAVTKLYCVDPQQPTECRLIYMTRLQFQERRNDYCKANGLGELPPEANKNHTTLVQENHTLATKLRAIPVAAGDNDAKLRRKYFEDLLAIYNSHGEKYIQSEPFSEKGDYTKHNTHYINHPEHISQAPDEYVLLREVEIGYPTKYINSHLHLLDLPGLGTAMSEDDSLTLSYLPNLDGAIIVITAEHVATSELNHLLKRLKKQYGALHNRVWVVINKWSGISGTQLYGDTDSPMTVFDNIDTKYRDVLPAKQLQFTENEYYKKYFKAHDTDSATDSLRRPNDQSVSDFLHLQVHDGKLLPPPALEKYPQQQQLFTTMLNSGGVPELRQAIEQTIVTAVRGQVEIDTCQELLAMAQELEDHVQAARDRAHLPIERIMDCSHWQGAIQRTLVALRDRVLLETPLRNVGLQLRKTLRDLCGSILVGDEYTNTARITEAIANQHANTIQTTLSRVANTSLLNDFVKKLIQAALEILQNNSSGLPELKLLGSTPETENTVPYLLKVRLDSIVQQANEWLLPIVNSIQTTPLFALVDTKAGKQWDPDVNVEQYRELMQGKLDVIMGNALLAFEGRLREAFEDIQQRITLMMNVKDKDTPTNDAIYTQLLTEIASLTTALKTHVRQHRGGNHAA